MHPFTDRASESVAAVGELGLVTAIRRWLGDASPKSPFGIGDDCAIVPTRKGQKLLTVDPVIYGEHFDDTTPPRAAGKKLFNRNLSDIAAMGGRPIAAVVALAFDARVKTRWLASFYKGLADVSRRFAVPIVGGDISRLPGGIVATLTLLGEAGGARVLTRQGARIGDRIYVTGELGGSLRGHHLHFTPRLVEGNWLARQSEVRAMMDISDGLAKDIHALTPRGSRPALDPSAVPISPAARLSARASGRAPLDHALSDGEDYELAFVVSSRANHEDFERRWRRTFSDVRLSCLGRFQRSNVDLAPGHLDLASYHGFEHLVSPRR